MTQDQRLEYLIHYLLAEREEYRDVALPASPAEKRRLLRALVNVRPPEPLDQTFYQVQDAYSGLPNRWTRRFTRCRTPICRRNCAAKG